MRMNNTLRKFELFAAQQNNPGRDKEREKLCRWEARYPDKGRNAVYRDNSL